MIKPLHDYVLISPKESTETKSGLILANANVENEGTVVETGPEVKHPDFTTVSEESPIVKVGDMVKFDLNTARKIDKYWLVSVKNIYCVIEM